MCAPLINATDGAVELIGGSLYHHTRRPWPPVVLVIVADILGLKLLIYVSALVDDSNNIECSLNIVCAVCIHFPIAYDYSKGPCFGFSCENQEGMEGEGVYYT